MISHQRIEKLSVLIPAFQETVNLRWLLPRVFANLPSNVDSDVTVVVERDCPDDAKKEFIDLGARVLVRGPSDSFGDAMRTGLLDACHSSPWVIVLDADGSHDPATIPILLSVGEEQDADIVIASRYTAGGGSDNGFALYWMSRLLNFGYGFVLGIKAKDVSTNFKLYRTSLLEPQSWQCDNFDVVEEILARALIKKPGLRIVEVPDHFYERKAGESKRKLGPFIASYLLTLYKLRKSQLDSRS